MAISWKWTQLAQNWLTRQNWGLFWHLAKFCQVLAPPVCLKFFGSSISFDPGRFGFCSCWQTCRTQLVLQDCQLHYLLIRHCLGVNLCQSSYVRHQRKPLGELCLPSWPTGRSTWLPFGTPTPALDPLVRPSMPSRMAHHPCTRPTPFHLLCLSLARLRRHRRHRYCRRELRELRAPSSSCRVTTPGISESASSSTFFSTSWPSEIASRWAAFLKFSIVGFAAITTPTLANLTAAPSLPSFFCLCHDRACWGHRCGLCHTLPSLVAPSCDNTTVVPPRSPLTTTLHMSRLTGASRVRSFYLGSSALSHWCLSHPSPMLYQSKMVGVSWDSPAVPPWPTATSSRCSNPWTTYLYRRGKTQGACRCPWIHRRSSPSASIRRRVSSLLSVSLTCRSRCQWLNISLLSFVQILDFGQSCKNHISSFWAPKIVKQILW